VEQFAIGAEEYITDYWKVH